MPPKKVSTPEDTAQADYRRENALRPNPFLGYNRNMLAMHLIKCEAFSIAESELRRCIWLNPYEPAFKANLAWCLHKQRREEEARENLKQAIEQGPDNDEVIQVARLMGLSPDTKDTCNGDEPQRG